MKRNTSMLCRAVGTVLSVAFWAASAAAQSAEEKEFIEAAESGGGWFLAVGLMVIAGLGVAYYLWRKSAAGDPKPKYNYDARYQKAGSGSIPETVDADREPEALRKAKKSTLKAGAGTVTDGDEPITTPAMDDLNFETKAFQERMRKLQYVQLPVNSFSDLSPSEQYEVLPLSNDESLVNAIDQANDEFEEDENVRELSLRILARFRTRNSIDALSEIALYDLSANLRSKAVTSLTEFDHESVFEAILLACADPTREVRAAAARGLFRLNFDRAEAWKRIIDANDEFRMSHAARAAIESGIVVKSFDRLVHDDLKIAYEAYSLVVLLIKAGETREIFEAITTNRDERVKFALLHVLKVVRDERTLVPLHELLETPNIPAEVVERAKDAVGSFESIMA
ncbi:MAG: HEAT repeat domain-containing protein [Pyrinomonadaceae bacterium]